MTAAELLRGLAREPVTPADADTIDRLLPLLAGLVEAVGRLESMSTAIRHPGKQPTMDAILEARDGVSVAYAALNAAAAKEV